MADAGDTGTPCVTCNRISVLDHALQGAETEDKHVHDAEQTGYQDLGHRFRDVEDGGRQVSDRARRLLGRQLAQG